MNRQLRPDRAFYKKILIIALPIVLQNLLDAAVNTADVVMLDLVSQQSMSAVSLAANIGNVVFMFLYGAGSAMTMLGSQYWGKGDVPAIERAQGIALRYTLMVSLVTMTGCLFFPAPLMGLFTKDAALIGLGVRYLRVFALAIPIWGVSSIYLSSIRSTGRVAVCTAVEIAALLMNVALNALFLFVFRMDAAGAAWGTLLSRAFQLLLCVILSARSKTVRLRLAPMFRRHGALEGDFTRMALPAICNDLIWGIAVSVYTAILGRLSSDAVAANAIVSVVRNLGGVLAFGLSGATGILLGQILGSGDIDGAISAAGTLLKLSVVTGLMGGACIWLLTPFISAGANLTDTARDYLRFMLMINGIYLLGAAVNTNLIVGVFRSGGDAGFGLRCDLGVMWCWGVPIGLLTAFVFKWDVKWVYLALCTDEFMKWPWVFRHYFSRSWAKNITRELTD